MTFVSLKELMPEAKRNQYAIGQFNMNSFQWAQAILRAAEREQSPVILASTDRIVDYLGGFKLIATTTKKMVEEMEITVTVVLHLDHGLSIERCKEVVEYANKYQVSVEAEIGSVGGTEDGVSANIKYADPDECYKLVKETKVDLLAAALGSVHGVYEGEPDFAFDLMQEISTNLKDVP